MDPSTLTHPHTFGNTPIDWFVKPMRLHIFFFFFFTNNSFISGQMVSLSFQIWFFLGSKNSSISSTIFSQILHIEHWAHRRWHIYKFSNVHSPAILKTARSAGSNCNMLKGLSFAHSLRLSRSIIVFYYWFSSTKKLFT